MIDSKHSKLKLLRKKTMSQEVPKTEDENIIRSILFSIETI